MSPPPASATRSSIRPGRHLATSTARASIDAPRASNRRPLREHRDAPRIAQRSIQSSI